MLVENCLIKENLFDATKAKPSLKIFLPLENTSATKLSAWNP